MQPGSVNLAQVMADSFFCVVKNSIDLEKFLDFFYVFMASQWF